MPITCSLSSFIQRVNSTLLDYQRESLLAHEPELQVVVSLSFPAGHPADPRFPPLQNLFLVLVPVPQVALQSLYDDH